MDSKGLTYQEIKETLPDHLKKMDEHIMYFIDHAEYQKSIDPELSYHQIRRAYIKDQFDMHNGMMQYVETENDIHRRNKRLLRVIKSVKGATYFHHLMEIINESYGITWLAEIVRKPIGEFNKEPHGREITGIWIDQHSVGMEGDSFVGTICVPLRPGRWFKFDYSM